MRLLPKADAVTVRRYRCITRCCTKASAKCRISEESTPEPCISYWADVNFRDSESDVRAKVASLSACVRTCFANPRCQAFSFRKQKWCVQKEDVLKSRAMPAGSNMVSGTRCDLNSENGPDTAPDGFQFSKCKDQADCGNSEIKKKLYLFNHKSDPLSYFLPLSYLMPFDKFFRMSSILRARIRRNSRISTLKPGVGNRVGRLLGPKSEPIFC